jgi:phosphoglycerol transferase MdoB-like AlkP superfamily enzyme
MLCGMYPRLEMPIIETLDGNLPLPCLPALLARAGYRTAFLQSASGRFENRPGLVRNLGFEHGAFLETLERDGRFARTGYFGLDEFAMLEPAVSWAAGGGEEPYLLTVLTVTPHHPYEVPGERGAWRGESLAQYRAAIRHQDRFLGALLGALGARGALDDAVVFVVGDHGEAFGEHGRLQHDAVPYEEVVKVPLLVLGPESRVGPPRRIGGLRHHVDLMPTVFRLAGIEWRGRLPGEDLFSGDGHARVIASCWYSDYCLAMREGDRKTVFHFWRRPTQVFDLGDDPGELVDLASSLEAREVRAAERSMLAFKRSIDAFYAEHPIVEGPPLWWNQSVD